MKNCVLTTGTANIQEELERFVKSFRKHNTIDDIVIMMPDYHINEQACRDLKQQYNVRIATYSFQFCNNLADLMTKRFVAYMQYLKQFEYNKVFMCDSRDMLFQGNIFDYNFKEDIVVFKEINKVKDNNIAKGWLNAFDDLEVRETIANSYNICLGTLLGSYSGVLKFIPPFLDKMFSSGLPLNYDQIIYNYLIHTNAIEGLTHQYQDNHGPVATIGDQDAHKTVSVKENGTVVIDDTYIPLVVHQWDRLSLNLQNKIKQQFE
jgi:hypothetical protein